jgi:NAD(P)-dependent dehydrogenase (short-subunit alcohol dehydrogenase family)
MTDKTVWLVTGDGRGMGVEIAKRKLSGNPTTSWSSDST